MKQTIKLLQAGFESSTVKTPEFIAFARQFKKEFAKELQNKRAVITYYHVGHFDLSGFFKMPSGALYYFSLCDVRGIYWNGLQLMYRTAKHEKDWTGGCNQWVDLEPGMINNMRLVDKLITV